MVRRFFTNARAMAIASLALGFIVYGGFVWRRVSAARDVGPPLLIEQVAPVRAQTTGAAAFLAKPGEPCEYSYQLTNRSAAVLDGLRLASCQCQVAVQPATRLQPGESTKFTLSVRAPRVGESRTQIPIYVNGGKEPVASIDIAIRVPVEPPMFDRTPSDIHLESVVGVPLVREVFVETIERKESEKWIDNLKVTPPDLLAWRLAECREKPIGGTELVQRTYQVELSLPSDATARAGSYVLGFTHDPDTRQTPSRITVVVHDPISVFPSSIAVGTDTPARMVVILRSSEYRVELGESSPGLSVTPQPESSAENALAFSVRAVGGHDTQDQGTIRLLCRKGEEETTREIPVRFLASAVAP